MRLAKWLIFFGCISSLDALRDAGYGHQHWMRQEFLWTDWWHLVKAGAFYGPLVVILWQVWPLVTFRERPIVLGSMLWYQYWDLCWYNVPRWLAAAAVGWGAWEVAVRLGGAPWLN